MVTNIAIISIAPISAKENNLQGAEREHVQGWDYVGSSSRFPPWFFSKRHIATSKVQKKNDRLGFLNAWLF